MDESTIIKHPKRITDLIFLKELGYDLNLDPSFDIVPVNFAHTNYEFQAYIFLCTYAGTINKKPFMFRKCYAQGCPHNLCPHVAQAVMIANRYLKRDYKKLLDAGISIEETFFTLEGMLLKYNELDLKKDKTTGDILTIHDYINIAKKGNKVDLQINLDIIPAVEHFSNQKNKQTFLMADFNVNALGQTNLFQKCLSCFNTNKEATEKPISITTANERLKILFTEFENAKITYKTIFFN